MSIVNFNKQKILENIEQNLAVRQDEKNKYGEVFTPAPLIEIILDTIPSAVWKNPDLRWLDPAAGSGNFFALVFPRLMEGLSWEIADKRKREKHILEKMFHMVELNKENAKRLRTLFGEKAKIVTGDYLKTTFDDEKFDVILGNPPFQEDAHVGDEGYKYIRTGSNKLYEKFIRKSIDELSEKGWLAFISPDNVFTGNTNPLYREILEKTQVHVLGFDRIQETYFPGIQQDMCYFLLRKSQENQIYKTKILPGNAKPWTTFLQDRPINPVREWTSTNDRLLKKYISNVKNQAVYFRGGSAKDYTGGKYEVIYSETQRLRTDNPEFAKGRGIPKIVLFETDPTSQGVMDETGKYGVGPHTFYVPFQTKKEGRKLKSFFRSDAYKKLVEITTTSYYLKTALILYLKLDRIAKNKRKTHKNSQPVVRS